MLNRQKFEKDIHEILRKAYLSTFEGLVYTEDAANAAKAVAMRFADTAAPKLAESIDSYIKSADITLSVAPSQAFNVTGVCSTGPVTGLATGPLTGEIKLGIK